MTECGSDRGANEDDGSDKDFTSSAEIVVQRVREPTTDKGGSDVRGTVDRTDFPLGIVSFPYSTNTMGMGE